MARAHPEWFGGDGVHPERDRLPDPRRRDRPLGQALPLSGAPSRVGLACSRDRRCTSIPVSNPANAVRGMLAYKRLDHRLVRFAPGFHPLLVRAAGFPGWTVPALETVDGRKLQGSLAISRYLDELQPDPPLFPADRARRRAVEEAERWGEAELQPVPRRIFRRALATPVPAAALVHRPRSSACRSPASTRSSRNRCQRGWRRSSTRPRRPREPTSPACRRCSTRSTR